MSFLKAKWISGNIHGVRMTTDWTRIFPDTDHRWTMGLRLDDSLVDFFADEDSTGTVRAERIHWLADDAKKYAAIMPEAESALHESVELARFLGAKIAEELPSSFDVLLDLGCSWEPDFVWMHPGADGVHRLIGGVVCFPSSWALRDKLGRPMSEVHDPVPGLNAAIGRKIDVFLAKLDPGVVWRRENWSLSRDSQRNHHPSRPRRRLDATVTVAEVWIRLEHQMLLKLQCCGSVLFGIRVEVIPLTNVLADAQAAARFARIIATMTPDSANYKDVSAAGPALLGMLKGLNTK